MMSKIDPVLEEVIFGLQRQVTALEARIAALEADVAAVRAITATPYESALKFDAEQGARIAKAYNANEPMAREDFHRAMELIENGTLQPREGIDFKRMPKS